MASSLSIILGYPHLLAVLKNRYGMFYYKNIYHNCDLLTQHIHVASLRFHNESNLVTPMHLTNRFFHFLRTVDQKDHYFHDYILATIAITSTHKLLAVLYS